MNPEDMNHEHEHQHEPTPVSTRTPEAVEAAEVSDFAVHGDPSQTARVAEAAKRVPGRGVEWVRPADLMTRAGSHVAGRGIDFQAELARRARTLGFQKTPVSRTGIDKRSHRLPPASAFGRNSGAPRHSWVSRSGLGRG
ncbi:MAG: hypothetical protein KKF42_03780 [Actinobacteria bacterium]|nr:hypothetical protein [Actinomycetota bacterium]